MISIDDLVFWAMFGLAILSIRSTLRIMSSRVIDLSSVIVPMLMTAVMAFYLVIHPDYIRARVWVIVLLVLTTLAVFGWIQTRREKRKRDESPEKPKRWYVTDDGELVERTPLSAPPRGAYGVVRFSDQDIVAYTEREYESLSEAAWYENRQRVIAAQTEEHKRRYGRR